MTNLMLLDTTAYGYTLPEAYHEALKRLKKYGMKTPCPDYNTIQRECSMTMYVESATADDKPLLYRRRKRA